ncbi:MAG: 6-phosphofructokinase [Verrucomicrobiaceae bacterium]|nr:6-phosphofructokinase [Verrucomicrobiaceae bacterium]
MTPASSRDDLHRFANRPIAVLFSGGDAPGMNAFLRAITRFGLNLYNVPVLGVLNGYRGLVSAAAQADADLEGLKALTEKWTGRWGLVNDRKPQHLVFMDHPSVSGIVGDGGIILGSARCLEFKKPEVRAKVIEVLGKLGVRALIVVGGDGSLAGAKCLSEESNLRIVGVPATIDNDLEFSEMAIGVDTAVSTLVWAVDHFKDTARSHRRVMVLETMGAKSGELARLAAIASGAEVVIVPNEGEPLTEQGMQILAASIEVGFDAGRSHTIVLIAEGVTFEPEVMGHDTHSKRNRAYVLADAFKDYFTRPGGRYADLEIRPSVLGHLQRGGHTSPQDCILSARFAEAAIHEAMKEDGRNGVTALVNGEIEIVPFGAPPLERTAKRVRDYLRLHRALSSWTPVGNE